MAYALAIDLGGTKVAAAVVHNDGTIAARATRPTDAQKGGDWVLNRIKEAALEALDTSKLRPDEFLGVGMGTPGVVDTEKGIMLSEAVNIPDWKGRRLKAELERILGIPAFVENDANAGGLGELMFGAGKGFRHMIYVALGTGVGGAVIVNGKLVRGANFVAGEIGHISVDPNGPRCGCGSYGCIEAFASGPAIAMRAREYIQRGAKTKLQGLPLDEINAKEVAEAAKQGDPLACFVLAEAGKYLGILLAGITNLLNPECIVIGGGVSQAGDLLLEPVRWEVRRRALTVAAETLKIVPATLGADAGVLGAAALVFYH